MAREDVGALVARLVADTDGLRADMEKAARQVKSATGKMNRRLASTERNTRKMASGFGIMKVAVIAASAVMVGRFIKAQLDAAATILDTSEKIGLQVESLQQLRFAGAQFGIQQRQTDLAMQRFSRRVGEAVKGQGELKGTLLEYNIQLVDTEGKTRTVEAILLDYADAVQGADSAQEKLRLAFKAFDSEGAAFVNVMAQGSQGIIDLGNEAIELGIILDRDAVVKAKAASDEFTALTFVLQQKLLVAVVENADEFKELAEIGIETAEGLTKAFVGTVRVLGNLGAIIALLAKGDFATAGVLGSMKVGDVFGGAEPGDAAGGGGAGGGEAGGGGEGEVSAGDIAAFLGAGGGGDIAGKSDEELSEILVQPFVLAAQRRADVAESVRAIVNRIENNGVADLAKAAEKRTQIAEDSAAARIQIERSVSSAAVGFLNALGREHKGAAIAALAIQKVLAIKSILINSQVAATRALAELGPIAGPPVAAAILVSGKISAALVAATGLVEASQLSSGQGSLGTPAQPLFVSDTGTTDAADGAVGASGRSTVTIIFQGDVNGWDAFVEQRVITAISDAINERDVVLIRNNSRQAQEITRVSG